MGIKHPAEFELEVSIDCIVPMEDWKEIPGRAARIVDDIVEMLRERYPNCGVDGFKVTYE